MSEIIKSNLQKQNTIENTIENTTVTNIPRVAKFEKVSFEEFERAYSEIFKGDDIRLRYFKESIKYDYDHIRLPERATDQSAGYDFYLPYGVKVINKKDIIIPTGIRCKILSGWFLMLLPRSGLGFKTATRLSNTAGIIDSDYYYSDNSGHIMVKLTPDAFHDSYDMNAGDRFCQGIFVPFGITDDDMPNKNNVRHGGIGSTGK